MPNMTEQTAQALDLTTEGHTVSYLDGRHLDPDWPRNLARLVVAEHDRLCGRAVPALYCSARASCRQAAEALR